VNRPLEFPGLSTNRGFRGHIEEFDSIRTLGIALVLFNHFWRGQGHFFSFFFQLGELGWIAMDAFFVLSGFLITGILVDSRSRPDYFRNYYIRRSLRIFPLYYCVLAAGVIILKLGIGDMDYASFVKQWGSPAWFFVYLGNFRAAYMGHGAPVPYFAVMWSLQIEEQFYLLFPIMVRFIPRDRLSRLLWCLVFLSPLCRLFFFLWNPNNAVAQMVLLPCHMEGLALGGLIAIRLRSGPWKISKPWLTGLTFALLFVTCVSSFLCKPPIDKSPFVRLIGFSLSSFACASLFVWLIVFRGSRYTRFLRIRVAGYFAMISYGIYLLHPLVLTLVGPHMSPGIHQKTFYSLRLVFLSALSILAASISWYAFERPLARLKDRLAPDSRSGGKTQVRGSTLIGPAVSFVNAEPASE
jgi:peptidoglycan/LPS O-acetylase OafA/YrhL